MHPSPLCGWVPDPPSYPPPLLSLVRRYMVAQHGLKGTACPSHYHMIYDDSNFSAPAIQKLTFELCHLYARATKIVSRPAPVYYAHRAAFLAQVR